MSDIDRESLALLMKIVVAGSRQALEVAAKEAANLLVRRQGSSALPRYVLGVAMLVAALRGSSKMEELVENITRQEPSTLRLWKQFAKRWHKSNRSPVELAGMTWSRAFQEVGMIFCEQQIEEGMSGELQNAASSTDTGGNEGTTSQEREALRPPLQNPASQHIRKRTLDDYGHEGHWW